MRLIPLLLAAWLSAGVLAAKGNFEDVLPACSRDCLMDSYDDIGCAYNDADCLCNFNFFESTGFVCLMQNCTVRESLATQKDSKLFCDVPVRNKTPLFVKVTIILGVIALLAVVTRIVSKFCISKSYFGLDDLFIVLTLLFGIPSSILNCVGTAANGEGKDIWMVDPEQLTRFTMYFYILDVLYFAQVSLLKMSLIFFYLRIFLGRTQRLLWGTVIFNACYGFSFVIVAIFICSPISYFWTNWDHEHEGKCLNVNTIGWANAAISIALDVWMLAIPLWELRTLRLHWKKKIGVASMFVVGTFVTVISMVRLHSLVDLGSSWNPTWDQTNVSIWSTVEINVGVICASMPSLRILLVRLFPILGGSSYDSSAYHNYPEDYGRKSSRGVSRSRALVELPSRGGSESAADHGGIELKRTYNVQYSDGDETSLVGKRGLGTQTSTGVAITSASEVSL